MRRQRPRRQEIVDEALSCPEANAAVSRGEPVSISPATNQTTSEGSQPRKGSAATAAAIEGILILYLFAPVIRTKSCSSGATVSHGATADPSAAVGRGASIVIVACVCPEPGTRGEKEKKKQGKKRRPAPLNSSRKKKKNLEVSLQHRQLYEKRS